jgi:hypothetical protein
VANSDLVNSAKEPFKMEDDQYLSDKWFQFSLLGLF